jgi:hypothetical protein
VYHITSSGALHLSVHVGASGGAMQGPRGTPGEIRSK